MKRFLLKISLFALIFLLFDRLFLIIRNRSPKQQLDNRLEKVLNNQLDADVYVLGSSRGARNVIASQIQDSIGIPVYNLSYPGSNIEFHEYLLRRLLKFEKKKPGLVILAVDDMAELTSNSSLVFRLDRLYPLVKYDDVRNTLVEKGEKNPILSKLFILHQLSRSNFERRQVSVIRPRDTITSCGSMPISFQSDKFDRKYSDTLSIYAVGDELEYKRASFLRFIDLCNKNGIQLIIAFPPNFRKPTIGFESRIKFLANNKASFMHYDTTKVQYTEENYYFDGSHLKNNGAKLFTSELATFVKHNFSLRN